ncbi:MAG: MotA/TolQ/ExbB proton channel family protein [Firmicutes bacterium]|jgi:biopolymer transport protein ExbB|nr:MotA/TolQ/ExbB proton channel family protein [Bacillota bacterium]
MLDLIIRGGPVMIPLLLCSVLVVAVSLERLVYLLRCRVDTEDLMDDIKLALQQGKILEAIQIAKKTRGPVAAVLAAGIAHYDKDKQFIRERLEEVAYEEVFRMERRLGLLDAIITAAPLLGLLGTVTGIINSFQVISAVGGLDDTLALSSGIAEALITTATGLIIAIPGTLIYSYLSGLIDRIVVDINKRSSELLAIFEARGDV